MIRIIRGSLWQFHVGRELIWTERTDSKQEDQEQEKGRIFSIHRIVVSALFCMRFRAIVMPWCSRSIRFTDGQGLIIVLKPCNAIPGRSRSRSSLSVLLQYHDPLLLVLTTLTMLSARLFGYYEIEHRVEILLMRCMSFPAPGSINVLVDLAMARFVVFDIWIQYLARND